jgi:glutamate formiminotransferase / 5-formyltetrahydrofolate cyclo-ligase
MDLVECVPNVSEGRRQDVVDALAVAIRSVRGVRLLDRSSDGTHNRSVLTLAGSADAVTHAVLRLVDVAIGAIDLRTHTGAHPRLGAVDVVPFIPISGVSMADCVHLARTTAAEVAARFDLPVFLYEEAASTSARRNLADIRRGEFEGLAAKMASPEWAPDYGPSRPHPSAGATVIGARAPLVAFNINLATDRVETAKSIAAAVRQSSGGLPFVKAIGLALDERGLVQVSMNLTNFEQTSIARVFDAVRQEAERRGTTIVESEIVGLVPAAALPPAPQRSLRLVGFTEDQVLERRLARETH